MFEEVLVYVFKDWRSYVGACKLYVVVLCYFVDLCENYFDLSYVIVEDDDIEVFLYKSYCLYCVFVVGY